MDYTSSNNLLLERSPISSLDDCINLNFLTEEPVTTSILPQDMFQVSRAANLLSLDYSNESKSCKTVRSQYPSEGCADLSSLEEMFPSGTDMSATMDWLTENINFESSGILSNEILDIPALENSYDISSDVVNETQSNNSIPSPCLSTIDLQSILESSEELSFSAVSSSDKKTLENSDDTRETSENSVQHIESPISDGNTEAMPECNSKEKSSCLASRKYKEMRRKNNIASQQSRKARKLKDLEMEEKLKKLEIENKQLSLLAEDLEKRRDALQRHLLQIISKK